MTAVNWSREQQAVIGAKHQDILVSAAAGSGKTSVLIERIFKKITDRSEPVNVDDLLIVTFTENAADEMKQRLRARLQKAVEEAAGEPEYAKQLREQLIRLPQAQISTIHGFCQTVIRSWFTAIDLDPDLRVLADEGEAAMLKKECIDQMLEEEFARGDTDFFDFVDAYASKRDDDSVEEMILALHKIAESFPDPARWLTESTMLYAPGDGGEEDGFGTEELMGIIKDYIRRTAEEAEATLKDVLQKALGPGGPYTYEEALEDDLKLLGVLCHTDSFAEMRQAAADHGSWMKLSNKKVENLDDSIKKWCKDRRDRVKDQIDKHILKPLLRPDPQVQRERLAVALRHGKELTRLVLRFGELFNDAKRSRKLIDFADMEHLALEILQTKDESGNAYISEYYRSYFKEVMVDEYQDSNYLQEEIFKAVSGGNDHNLFMVGDVKQSIYRFRQARPELFIAKQTKFAGYDEEGSGEAGQVCILLSKNYRSSGEVIDFVNDVFYKLFDESVGGISYTRDTALYQGNENFPEGPDRRAEVWVIPKTADESDEDDEAQKQTVEVLEARCIASRIRQLMEEYKVTDKETKKLREIRYSDIVILSRALSSWGDAFYETLIAEGIPVYMERKQGFFETREVQLMIEMLRLLDNQRRDIALTSVMMSVIGRFTNDELAMIKAAGREYTYFHEAAEAYRDRSDSDELSVKLCGFYDMIDRCRLRAAYTPVQRLLRDIVDETGVRRYFEALPGGEQRSANLDLLIDTAGRYAKTGYRGLSKFLEYIDGINKNRVDYGEAGLLDESANVVRVMTIHKSKGMEFPVVFIAGMGRKFNTSDQSGRFIVQPNLGIGLGARNPATREKSTTPVREIVRHQLDCDDLGELMRVLYVAMTRTKEKLIMTGYMEGIKDHSWTEEYALPEDTHGCLSYSARISANCFYDWVLPIVAGGATDALCFTVVGIDGEAGDLIRRKKLETLMERELSDEEKALADKLRGQMDYRYPYEKTRALPLKVSVSDLKQGRKETDVYIPDVRPQCLKSSGDVDPSERGTVHHKVLQRLEMNAGADAESLNAQIARMQAEGYLDEQETAMLDRGRLLSFLESDLCRRMAAASDLHKEQPFVIGVDARQIDDEYPEGETVLVQGIIDAYFTEDGRIVIVDYKTDRVRDMSQLAERYRVQMDWYARALEQTTGMEVAEKIIYSLELSDVISI